MKNVDNLNWYNFVKQRSYNDPLGLVLKQKFKKSQDLLPLNGPIKW